MDFILTLHAINRWIIVALGLIALVKFAIGWLGRRSFQPLDRGLMSGYTGLLDLQLLLGIILLIGLGFESFRVEHAITMVVAVVLAHLAAIWRKADDRLRFRNNFFIILATLVVIYLGIAALPQGWLG